MAPPKDRAAVADAAAALEQQHKGKGGPKSGKQLNALQKIAQSAAGGKAGKGGGKTDGKTDEAEEVDADGSGDSTPGSSPAAKPTKPRRRVSQTKTAEEKAEGAGGDDEGAEEAGGGQPGLPKAAADGQCEPGNDTDDDDDKPLSTKKDDKVQKVYSVAHSVALQLFQIMLLFQIIGNACELR